MLHTRVFWQVMGMGVILLSSPSVAAAPVGDATGETRTRVAVTGFTTHGVSTASRQLLGRSLEGGLSGAGLQVLGVAAVRHQLTGQPALRGCETSVCLARIGKLLRAPLASRAVVEDLGGGTFRVALKVTLTRTGRVAYDKSRDCAPCTTDEAAEALSRMARAGGKQAAAQVRRARIPPRRTNGQGNGQPKISGPSRSVLVTGAVLLGVGAAGVAAGGALLGLHNTRTEAGCAPGYARCYRNTRTAGIVATAVGGAALFVGATMLVYYWIAKRQARVTVGVDPVRRAVFLRGRF